MDHLGVLVLLFVSSASVAVEEDGQLWALLVAGSNGWYNYRHQADVCHAYQVLHRHGIPDERIVVMMFDDLANNTDNPTKGVVINHPNGSDVYHGVPKDYTGEDVTPENFINILLGDKAAMAGIGSGKVIGSGPNDHVFVNFVDHGAPGLVAFPDGELHASDLHQALMSMHAANKYKQMVIYIEACESGSMFSHGLLPDNINVYATTAANGKESSYACYFDDTLDTYLGDVYSVKWMEDSDQENLNKETLHKQFKIVREETNTSHVQQYGNKLIAREDHVGDFQGNKQDVPPIVLPKVELGAVASEDVPLAILQHRLKAATTYEEQQRITAEILRVQQENADIVKSMRAIVSLASSHPDDLERLLSERQDLTNHKCYKAAVKQYDTFCWDISTYDYALRQLYALVNLCEEHRPMHIILSAIQNVCVMHLY